MKTNSINKQIIKLLTNSIIVFSFIVIISLVYEHWEIEKDAITQTKHDVNMQVDNAVTEISLQLGYLMGTGQLFADQLSNGTIAYSDAGKNALNLLKQRKKQQINFFGVQIAFAKGVYDKNKPDDLIDWYYYYDPITKEIKSKKSDYDYTLKDNLDKDSTWFTKAIETQHAFWQEPHFGTTTNEFIVGYSIPFFDSPKKEKAIGVITINLSINELKNIVYAQDYRKIGYSIILSPLGNIIYHPDPITTLKSASEKHRAEKETFNFISQLKQNNHHDTFDYYFIPEADKKAWILSRHIALTDWDIYVIVFKDELKTEQKNIATDLWLVVATLIFIIALSSRYLLNHHKQTTELWYVSTIVGCSFLLAIATLWYFADIRDFKLDQDTYLIKSEKEVEAYKKTIDKLAASIHKPQPYYIPTGVFIKSTKFDGSNNIDISGYIWQKYDLNGQQNSTTVPEHFCDMYSEIIPKSKGVVLFEAEEEKIDLSCDDINYSAISNGQVTLGWYFKVQLREPFDYSNYPLDKNSIWLRLRSNSWNEKIILIPDLRAYPFIFEKALSGIDADNLVLPSWDVQGTFYAEKAIALNTNLGINGYAGQTAHELIFNIVIERDFLDAFISTIIPIFIIYLILFVILFSSLHDILAVLGINAGLLFSVALWHSGLRTSLASSGITYFETFYFICYFVISLICINSVLLASDAKLTLLRYENNLIPKLVFLPLVFGLTFIITLIILF